MLRAEALRKQKGPIAQWWSRGLIILWFSVRIWVGPPSKIAGHRLVLACDLFLFISEKLSSGHNWDTTGKIKLFSGQ